MVNRAQPADLAFLKLNGQTIRVTSWKPAADEQSAHLVVISRGTRDAETLAALLEASLLTLAIESEPDRVVTVGSVDRRSFGEGQSGITRFGIDLHFGSEPAARHQPDPVADPTPERSLEERVADLETEVASLKARLARWEAPRETAD